MVNVEPNRCPVGSTEVTLLTEGFDGSFPPAGWTIANSTTSCVAPGVPDWTNTDPGARGNLTGGTGMFADRRQRPLRLDQHHERPDVVGAAGPDRVDQPDGQLLHRLQRHQQHQRRG